MICWGHYQQLKLAVHHRIQAVPPLPTLLHDWRLSKVAISIIKPQSVAEKTRNSPHPASHPSQGQLMAWIIMIMYQISQSALFCPSPITVRGQGEHGRNLKYVCQCSAMLDLDLLIFCSWLGKYDDDFLNRYTCMSVCSKIHLHMRIGNGLRSFVICCLISHYCSKGNKNVLTETAFSVS